MSNSLHALATSVTALAETVAALEDDDLTRSAYPLEWTVADTLSHLGSGAVIMTGALGFARDGVPMPENYMTAIWDEWNAKTPPGQAHDLAGVDRALVDALEAVGAAEAGTLRVPMGDHDIPFTRLVQHRLDEHALHSWDVRVAFDPAATLLDEVVADVLDGVEWVVGLTGKPIPEERTVTVHTFDPARTLRLELGPDAVIVETESETRPGRDLDEVHLPAEAFVRLVYGRLDADHTPPGVGGSADLDELREIFTGY
jgi:uncharacterized protein (TIGR03083 family)